MGVFTALYWFSGKRLDGDHGIQRLANAADRDCPDRRILRIAQSWQQTRNRKFGFVGGDARLSDQDIPTVVRQQAKQFRPPVAVRQGTVRKRRCPQQQSIPAEGNGRNHGIQRIALSTAQQDRFAYRSIVVSIQSVDTKACNWVRHH